MKRSSFIKSIAALFVAPKLVSEINFEKKDLWARENLVKRLPEKIRGEWDWKADHSICLRYFDEYKKRINHKSV